MNVGRFVGAVLGVWVVRVVLNFLFYGVAMTATYESLSAAHPGVFREVIPGLIATDLVVAVLLVYLWAKAGRSFGGGTMGGAKVGLWLGLVLGLVVNLYNFFGFTFMSLGLFGLDTVYQLVTAALQGAVAAAIYKDSAPA